MTDQKKFQSSGVIGQRIPKLDAMDKATGRAEYGHDLRLPGMLHGKILYSGIPHARIVSMDVSRARRLPGVKAVITGAENPAQQFVAQSPPTRFVAYVSKPVHRRCAAACHDAQLEHPEHGQQRDANPEAPNGLQKLALNNYLVATPAFS